MNTAAGSAANGTVAVDTFGNFTHLAVQGGTWNINGASTASNASLTGGTAILNNSGGLGTGAIVVGGGTSRPARPG